MSRELKCCRITHLECISGKNLASTINLRALIRQHPREFLTQRKFSVANNNLIFLGQSDDCPFLVS